MIYPENIEAKIGFADIRQWLHQRCLSALGQSQVEQLHFSDDVAQVQQWLDCVREMRPLLHADDFHMEGLHDVRQSVRRARLEGTFMEEEELHQLRSSLRAVNHVVRYVRQGDEDEQGRLAPLRPALYDMADGIQTFAVLVQQLDQLLDSEGHVRDNASPELLSIRQQLARAQGSVSRILQNILRRAQSDGVVERDLSPMMRDGRLMLPVAAAMKRRIPGIVYDESASGRTVFIEPTEVVEANNKIRELEAEERHEVVRLLTRMTQRVRPQVVYILDSLEYMAQMDLLQAKARMADDLRAVEPTVQPQPHMDWIEARHPLLERKLRLSGDAQRSIVPLDMMLTNEQSLLIISGPNAGGKSVCLKTVGLLQYMLQCGLSIPVNEHSTAGIFRDIMIDIGDEQSLENDLSTYSSHLLNMKTMLRHGSYGSLLLIDEFGAGTEPQIGGALAQAILHQFLDNGVWGVITTHYQNLKHYADTQPRLVNGAMLYDRHEMRPLFQLSIGRPGSSFAVDIARKIGLPQVVIEEASDMVGSDYIQSDKYLQDIVRDKRYWERKRETVHQQERELREKQERYDQQLMELDRERRNIMAQAKQEARELLREANRRIENTVREIKEAQAERERTRHIREEMAQFKEEVENDQWTPASVSGKQSKDKNDAKLSAEDIERKIAQIKARRERHEERKRGKKEREAKAAEALRQARNKPTTDAPLREGDAVRIRGTQTVGQIERIEAKEALVVFGGMRTRVAIQRLERVDAVRATQEGQTPQSKMDNLREGLQQQRASRITQDTIDTHRSGFRQDLDVRGMRGDEALTTVQHFVDDAILMGVSRVRILHGKGNGILKQLIRQYLSAEPMVSHFQDEHVQFGGAGITVVDFD